MNQEQKSVHDKPLILLVDDVPQNVQILHQILDSEDYSFAIATSGEETLGLVERQSPDLILLDIMLGDIDGFEVCERIKKNPKTADIPIIFLTAKVSLQDKVRGFKLGAVDYITKPFEDAEVVVRVHTHVRLKRSMDMLREYNSQLTQTLDEMQASFIELKESQDITVAREKQNALKTLSITASHEMNQPVTVIQGYLDLLKQSMDPDSLTPSQQKYLDRIEKGLAKLTDTLEKFRKSSHLYLLDNYPGY
jgi:two-component system NtrC family sensor kinase